MDCFSYGNYVFLIPVFIGKSFGNSIAAMIQSAVFVILFLWFVDLTDYGKKRQAKYENYVPRTRSKKEKDIKIKPKAKPNRVKNKQD